MLTENGESIDFGSIAEDCLAEQQLVLVNCGRSEVTKSVLETRFSTFQPALKYACFHLICIGFPAPEVDTWGVLA